MKYRIPPTNWTSHLADAIEDAADGDTIVCLNPDMLWLAERAYARMCPHKMILFEVTQEIQ